jgi:UDP-N-acetylmuramate dehydrogenase
MSGHTTFRIGGPADIWCRPEDIDTLIKTVQFAVSGNIPYFIIGNGSNLLVRDGGIRGLVIETSALDGIRQLGDTVIETECGASLSKLAVFAQGCALTGLEFAYGIPGTVGGAVYMNAGAYGGEMKHCVSETDYAGSDGNISTLRGGEHRFDYRRSFFTDNAGTVILKTRVFLEKGDPQQIQDRMQELKRRRQESQPLQCPSAGSFFKRPEGFYAGKLISDCGLKGTSSGGAKVSEKHAGFIINGGNATCRDVLRLMENVQQTVRSRFGVGLEPEVKIIGEEPEKRSRQ